MTATRKFIVVHHSLTADSGTVSWSAIERWHIDTQGWKDVGYHAGVELAGDNYIAIFGRDELDTAAACKEAEMNQLGLHVCIIGNFDDAPPPKAQLECAAQRVIKPWMRRYGIPEGRIIGHRDAGLMAGFDWQKGQYKSCPGKLFNLDELRAMTT